MNWDAPLMKPLGGGRWHLRHGPIDLRVITKGAWGEVERRLAEIFPSILPELCTELTALRQPVRKGTVHGPVANRMEQAALPFGEVFVTPMAGVAGAVADHLRDLLCEIAGVGAVSVNNGGDISLQTTGPTSIGICEDIATGRIGARIEITPADGIGGVATSGWRGRSHSLGVADAVTVLAKAAAIADVAATLIANATNLDAPEITRRAASDLNPDSDLGARLVTVDVPNLSKAQTMGALDAGQLRARNYLRRGLIAGCSISVQGEICVLGHAQQITEKAIA